MTRMRSGMAWVLVALGVAGCGGGGGGGGATAPAAASSPSGGGASSPAGSAPTLAGCALFPANNIWNRRVDAVPRDAASDAYVAAIGATRMLHPDFGAGLYEGAPIGIPYVVVEASQPGRTVRFDYADESDPGPYPIPDDPPIEGGPDATGDRHVLILERGNCRLYELYAATAQSDGSWQAGSGAVYDLASNALRPDGWTSADAAGLPILPGLVRYDEVAAGEIRHAIRFTAPVTRRAHVWPARHDAASRTDANLPPMGQRFRLKADYDLSRFAPATRVILTAMKRYGLVLADNGSAWFISGTPDDRWDNDVLDELKTVPGSAFEAVDVSALQVGRDSGESR